MRLLGRRDKAVEEVKPVTSGVDLGQVDLEMVSELMPDRGRWESLVGRIDSHFGGLMVEGREEGEWVSLMQKAVDRGVTGLQRFDSGSLWRRALPRGGDVSDGEGERLRGQLRFGMFLGALVRCLGEELSDLVVSRGRERWDPLAGQMSFSDFVGGANGAELVVARSRLERRSGVPLILLYAMFGRQEIYEMLGQDGAREVLVYLSPSGRDTLFGQIMGEAEDAESRVSGEVVTVFMDVLGEDVVDGWVSVNVNPADVLVLREYLFLVYPAGFRKVLRHVRRRKGFDVYRRDSLVKALLDGGMLLNHEGYTWKPLGSDGWKVRDVPEGVVMGNVMFPGNVVEARLRGLAIRLDKVWPEEMPEVACFGGSMKVVQAY